VHVVVEIDSAISIDIVLANVFRLAAVVFAIAGWYRGS
jgi:hypothetical protein